MAITKIGTPELFDFSSTTTALQLPTGTTLQRPTSPSAGEWRFNTTDKHVEYWDGVAWFKIATESAAAFIAAQNFQTVAYTGNGVTQEIIGKIGKAASFNGSSSYISTGINVSTTLMTSRSYSFWFKQNSSTDVSRIFGGKDGTKTNNGMFRIREDNGTINYYSTTTAVYTWSTALVNSVWTHVALTDTGSLAKLYINGIEVTSPSLGTYSTEPNTNLQIGRGMLNSGSVGNYTNGSIDQVRIFNTSLTSGNVDTLFLETYASSTKSTTDIFGNGSGVALYEMEDNSLSSNFGQAAVFNGLNPGSRINLSSNPISGFSNLTMSCWINSTNINVSPDRYVLSFINEVGGWRGAGIRVTSTNKVEFIAATTSGSVYTKLSTATITSGVWYHICMTATQSETKIYINGSLDSTHSTGGFGTNNTGSFDIGMNQYNASAIQASYDGKIDQVRIFDAALSSSDITKLYEESSQIPTTNLVAHYTLNGNALDSAGSYDGAETSITYGNGVYGGTATNVNYLGMAFQPDLVWIKIRNGGDNNFLADSIRGANKLLQSNNAAQELTTTGGAIASFDTNGFTLQSTPPNYGINLPPYTYVAWCWRAAASTTTIPASGSQISSEVRANVAAGFSIVKWTGTGGTKTVAHGLSNQPKFMFVKNINRAHHGFGYHTDINQTGYIFVTGSSTSQASFNSGRNAWANGNQVPTTDVFGVIAYTGNDSTLYSSNYLGDNYIAYCWANIAGYQKIGSYIGNRPLTKTVYTTDNGLVGGANGFRPRFLMIKDSSTSGEDWIIVDSLREGASAPTKVLYPNTNGAEDSYTVITFTSNGFTVGNTGLANTNGATIIYLAIA